MTDFHTHILPAIDDGSKSVAESIEMLTALSEQGISRVVATPHFSRPGFFVQRQLPIR